MDPREERIERAYTVPRTDHAESRNRALPDDAKTRKTYPLFSGLLKYFPDALAEVAHVSFVGNEQHHPGAPLHWDRSKSTDEPDALMRHLVDAGTRDSDGCRHSAKVAWRALALLQKEIEDARAVEPEHDPFVVPSPEFNRVRTGMKL